MPTKRAILENLKRDELLDVVDRFGLEPSDRRAKAGLVDAVASSRKATIADVLEAFKRDTHSVLLATGSFWQGVDVPGEALSCLIVDKLPFDSPGDPLVAARIDLIRSRGGNPFMEYQLPAAIIALKQGLGRLIRKSSDRGVLCVLDVRIIRSRYGPFFLQSLPEVPLTHDLEALRRFFE